MLYMGQITIRDVNPTVFKEFKASAVRRGLTLGRAVTLAMEKYDLELKPKKFKFTSLKPVDWGAGTEHVSEDIDSILYGD